MISIDMKGKVFLISLAASIVFTSCQIAPREQQNDSPDTSEASTEQGRGGTDEQGRAGERGGTDEQGRAGELTGNKPRAGVNRNAVLIENSTKSEFDGKSGDEVFRVALLGDSVLSGTVAFTITNGEGELIYSDEFPAIMLAATYDESINTPAKQEVLIKKRIDEFFEANRFKQPAIEGDQPPHDAFFIEKAAYDNLKETKAPGFLYLIGKENTKHIAWSPLEQKVVMYFNCC